MSVRYAWRHQRLTAGAPEIEAAGFDMLIAVGPDSRHLAAKLNIPTICYKNGFDAAKHVTHHFTDGDLIIFKASGPTKFKHILKAVKRDVQMSQAPMDWRIEDQ